MIACKDGHHMKFLDTPIKSWCKLCDKCEEKIQWECPESNCYRYKICNDCIKPITGVNLDPAILYQPMIPPAKKVNPYKLKMCLAGTHPTFVDTFSNSYYDSKKCAICQKKSQEKNKKGDWMMHFCKQCSQCYCYECYGYPFQELVACKDGHQMEFL